MNEAPLSDCCGAPVRVGGWNTTHWYVCTNCGHACDPKVSEDNFVPISSDQYLQINQPATTDITFWMKEKEVMKICEDGSFYYLGEKVEGAKEVYKTMKKFLENGFEQ